MKLKHHLIAGAALAVCTASSFAALDPAACTAAVTSTTTAEAMVANCAPAATLFIGGASTMSGVVQGIANAQLFDTTAFQPIVITNATGGAQARNSSGVPALNSNIKAYFGKAKSTLDASIAGKLIYVVYNYNNGSAGGVSQLLGKTPKLADQFDAAKGIPEADVPFVGPAKDQTTPDAKTVNAFCGTTATGVTSTFVSGVATVACKSHTMLTADMALSDVRAQELYKLYAAAAKGKPSALTQAPLLLQSFGVAVSEKLYIALQKKNGLPSSCNTTDIDTAACQPSITSADYASLVAKNGKVASLVDLVGAANLDAADVSAQLVLARRDDLSGTQAASNIFFVNGQCGGNQNFADPKSFDSTQLKAGALLGGLAIRTDVTDDTASLDVQANVTGTGAKDSIASAGFAIGVAGTGNGAKFSNSVTSSLKGRFVKIDGLSPNFDGTNFAANKASRTVIANGSYPFAHTLYGMYVTKTMAGTKAPYPGKNSMVQAMLAGFKNSNLSNLEGLAYLDGATGVAAQQSAVNRANGNNCSPIVKL